MDGFAISANQIMPFRKRQPLRPPDISTSFGQPVHRFKPRRREPDAFGNMGMAMPIVGAPATVPVKEAARDIGGKEFARFLILKLMKTTFAATVAQCFPLGPVERRQRAIFPETPAQGTQRASSAAISCGVPRSLISVIGSPAGPKSVAVRV